MIKALNGLRREFGLPTVPTITGTRTTSRRLRKSWRTTQKSVREGLWAGAATRHTMEQHRRIETATPEEQRRIFEEGL